MAELTERVSRTQTAIQNWLDVDDVIAREDYPDAQLLLDRMRCATNSAGPDADELPGRVQSSSPRQVEMPTTNPGRTRKSGSSERSAPPTDEKSNASSQGGTWTRAPRAAHRAPECSRFRFTFAFHAREVRFECDDGSGYRASCSPRPSRFSHREASRSRRALRCSSTICCASRRLIVSEGQPPRLARAGHSGCCPGDPPLSRERVLARDLETQGEPRSRKLRATRRSTRTSRCFWPDPAPLSWRPSELDQRRVGSCPHVGFLLA